VLGGLGAFVAVSAVVICTPGPDTALLIRNTFDGGRRAGIATTGGVALGLAVWTLAASTGVIAILKASEPVFHTLRVAGGAYLVYLGVQSVVAALGRRRPDAPSSAERPLLSGRRAFRQGLWSNLGNPKIAVFFASLLPQFALAGGTTFVSLLALGLVFCAMGFAWLTLYAIAVSRARYLLAGRLGRAIDAAAGTILVALGIRLAAAPR
jgi:threonine/homoserine/homoserine lactone efflux protein